MRRWRSLLISAVVFVFAAVTVVFSAVVYYKSHDVTTSRRAPAVAATTAPTKQLPSTVTTSAQPAVSPSQVCIKSADRVTEGCATHEVRIALNAKATADWPLMQISDDGFNFTPTEIDTQLNIIVQRQDGGWYVKWKPQDDYQVIYAIIGDRGKWDVVAMWDVTSDGSYQATITANQPQLRIYVAAKEK